MQNTQDKRPLTMKHNVYLESKPRYETLDGLRGVAAIMVVIFHLMETYSKGPAYQIASKAVRKFVRF